MALVTNQGPTFQNSGSAGQLKEAMRSQVLASYLRAGAGLPLLFRKVPAVLNEAPTPKRKCVISSRFRCPA